MLALLFVISSENPGLAAAGNPDAPSQLPPAWLEAAGGFRIRLAPRCRIGRANANEIVIPSMCISRRHARIEIREAGKCWLSDLGSRNGTWVNGTRIADVVRLRDGDRVGIAQVRFTFRQRAWREGCHGLLA
jgi:hypothetical protein